MYRYFIITLLFILSAASSSARKWTPETLPMVHLKDATKYVCNPDGILKPATVDSADALLSALERDKEYKRLLSLSSNWRATTRTASAWPWENATELATASSAPA